MTQSRTLSAFGSICLLVICLAMLQLSFGEQRICGPGLRKTLDLVCPNGFNAFKSKRSSLSPEDDYDSSNDEEENFELSLDMLPFLTSMEANSLAKTRRRRHGIVHECCDKPCSMDELRTYCRRMPYSQLNLQ